MLGLGLCLMAGPVLAQQRPLLTEDPETVGDGLILLEAGIDHAWDETFSVSGLKGNVLRAPRLGFSFTVHRQPKRRIAPASIERFKHRIRELTRRKRGCGIR